MTRKSLEEWLHWQESLSPRSIDLGLDRVRAVADRLSLAPPAGSVFTVAGTNGKGSCVALLESLMAANGRSTGAYTSPHLVRFNERIRVDGRAVDDAILIECFEMVENARAGQPLTYFEFGTLAAMVVFSRLDSRVWLLEVGLGGRLDAVNIIDPDYSLLTTVDLDHQAWLGGTVEAIAAEKAGIMRSKVPAFFGDRPVPSAIRECARELDAPLHCFGEDFDYHAGSESWSWNGASLQLNDLPYQELSDAVQLRNSSLVFAAVEAHDPALLQHAAVSRALKSRRPDGRFQVIQRDHEWVLDVAHNPQAAAVLRDRLGQLATPAETTVVFGMMADKHIEAFVAQLEGLADRWVACQLDDSRASSVNSLALEIEQAGIQTVLRAASAEESFDLAARTTGTGGRILVCGSFRVVGPALRWLGLY